MRYNVLGSHDDVFLVPGKPDDQPLFIGLTERSGTWHYTIATGPYENDAEYIGDAVGAERAPWDVAASLMASLSKFATGDLITESYSGDDDGLYYNGYFVAIGESARFIVANGARFGKAASSLKEGRMAYTDTYYDNGLGQYVYRAFPTRSE